MKFSKKVNFGKFPRESLYERKFEKRKIVKNINY